MGNAVADRWKWALTGVLLGAAVISCGAARAETLPELLRESIERHDRIEAARAAVVAARERARVALGDWFPTLEQTANYGYERQHKPEAVDTHLPFREYDLKLTQKLWDFGATDAAIEKARLALEQAIVSLENARQDLILEGATAYLSVARAHQVLGFARQSEENIRKQTGLEEARVETGVGLSTDVLQAKTQLAGANARRIQSEGSLANALNRYRVVFGDEPQDLARLAPVAPPRAELPAVLDEALEIAYRKNPDLRLAALTEARARQDVRATRGKELFPKLEGVLERKWQENVAGIEHFKGESLAKVEMKFPFNLGLTAINTLRAAEADLAGSARTLADTRRRVEQEVRDAWVRWNTSRATAASLRNQAEIAGAFLDLARQERALGQRSLIDVLSGETSLINAQSDAASAETDVLIAVFTLLNATGHLDLDAFDGGAPPAPPPEARP